MRTVSRPVALLPAVAGLLSAALLCSDPAEPYPLAPELTAMADTAVAVFDTVRLHVTARGEGIESYSWSVPFHDTVRIFVTAGPSLAVRWTPADTGARTVRVIATGASGAVSEPAEFTVRVHLYAPVLRMPFDTVSVAVHDTLALAAGAHDTNGAVVAWLWSVDSDTVTRTTAGPELRLVWGVAGSGVHRVVVRARDDDGLLSAPCSVLVTVMLNAPWVRVVDDTTVAINDTVTLVAQAGDQAGGTVVAWVWDLGAGARDTTTHGTLRRVWSRADTGRHEVRVHVVDNDSVESEPGVCVVTVALFAPRVSVSGDTALCVHDTAVIRAAGTDSNGRVIAYVWQIDRGGADTAGSPGLRLAWGTRDAGTHVVRVRALDDDSVMSAAESCAVTVLLCPPQVRAIADTAVWINDTLTIQASATDGNGVVTAYVWQLDAGPWADTTASGMLRCVWGRQDTGLHTVCVRAIDDDTVASEPDTVRVTVALGAPVVALEAKRARVAINDTLVLRARGADSNGVVTGFAWAVGGGAWRTGAADSLAVVFRRTDTGAALVRVAAVDDDSVWSVPDTAVVIVALVPPVLRPVRDTVLAAGDSLALALAASDSNGTVERYYWDLGADGWDDSSSSPDRVIRYTGVDTVPVVAGVRDDDSTLVTDTFVVCYNHAPGTPRVAAPGDTAFVWRTPSRIGESRVTFRFQADDPNAPYDTLRYRLLLGHDSAGLAVAYEGRDTLFAFDSLDTGAYVWRLEVSDRHGAAADTAGAFVCVRQKRICFLGHSIVAGVGGDGRRGGFRRAVLDSLSSRCAPRERVRSMGHLVSGLLEPAHDDSSLALSSSVAMQMYDTLGANRWVNADDWVMMLGVNSHYSWREQDYCRYIIEDVYLRNPACRIFFLNGLPLPDSTPPEAPTRVQLATFNEWLEGMAEVRRSMGWQVHIVNACSTLSVDTVFNDSLFADYIHPNQAGYDRLGQAVWAKMLSP